MRARGGSYLATLFHTASAAAMGTVPCLTLYFGRLAYCQRLMKDDRKIGHRRQQQGAVRMAEVHLEVRPHPAVVEVRARAQTRVVVGPDLAGPITPVRILALEVAVRLATLQAVDAGVIAVRAAAADRSCRRRNSP